jgi:hypothetical protein
MRLPPRYPPPESNAYLIVGIAATLLGIATIYGSMNPSRYVQDHPNAYHNPTIVRGFIWLIIGLVFLIPAVRRKMKRK